uniref:Uncharacterized protein n=1 Tax=Rhizophora mucronata TaxID=61149 RepID=A0A2P2J0I3_RHIMU
MTIDAVLQNVWNNCVSLFSLKNNFKERGQNWGYFRAHENSEQQI